MHQKTTLSYLDATGEIAYNMTNDYMFRVILQKNQKVLKGLICSLLHLHPKQIQSIEIKNPINLSEEITGKDFILDINVILNTNTHINLEMQVVNEHNWPERSLSYLCRTFDQLFQGQKYEEALPVFHIGFLDFTLFPDHPEFYATYKMMNIKNHHVYSDKFVLSVINLNQTELATDEDKDYGLDHWARAFKAKTWEELKMLAKDNEFLHETADSLYKANADEIMRQRCRAREDAERHERTMKRDIRVLKEENASLKKLTSSLEEKNASLIQHTSSLEENIVSLKEQIARLEILLQQSNKTSLKKEDSEA